MIAFSQRPVARISAAQRHRSRLYSQNTSNRLRFCRAAEQNSVTNVSTEDKVPPGCSRYFVELTRPLGMVLEEKGPNDNIYVTEVLQGGKAARSGMVREGDMLISTSGIVFSMESDYNGVRVKGGEKTVQMNVLNEDFKTVMAAIGSHPANRPVVLQFQRCNVDGTPV